MIDAHARAAIDAITATGVDVYDADEIPATPQMPYVAVWIDNGRPTGRRLSASSPSRGWRLLTMFVGSTAGEARAVADATYAALEDRRLIVAERTCGACGVESSQPVTADRDDPAVYTGTTAWTFTSTPQH